MAKSTNKGVRRPWHDDDVATTLNIANGALSDLRDKPAEHRPATVEGYLMQRYRCSRARLHERIADAEDRIRRKRKSRDLAANWLETLRLIGDEISDKLYSKTADIAYDTSNRNAFNAQKFLIDKNDSLFAQDVSPASPATATGPSLVNEIEQEIFDNMSDVQEAQLNEIVEEEMQLRVKFERWLRLARKKLADQRAEDIDDPGSDDTSDDDDM